MNIPPKYEDVVAQLEAAKMINLAGEHVESHLEKQIDILRIDLDAALGREAALREELDIATRHLDRMIEAHDDAQQRLTVAEQLLAAAHTYVNQIAGAGIGNARRLTAQIETHFDGGLSALKPAEKGEGS